MKKGDYITNGEITRKILAVIDEDLIAYSIPWSAEEPEEIKKASENSFNSFDLKTHLERAGWKVVEKEWRPEGLEYQDRYYYIHSDGYISSDLWYGATEDYYRLKTKNVHKDKESAEEELKKIME